MVEGGFDHRITGAPRAVTMMILQAPIFLGGTSEVITLVVMIAGLSQISVEVANLEAFASDEYCASPQLVQDRWNVASGRNGIAP